MNNLSKCNTYQIQELGASDVDLINGGCLWYGPVFCQIPTLTFTVPDEQPKTNGIHVK